MVWRLPTRPLSLEPGSKRRGEERRGEERRGNWGIAFKNAFRNSKTGVGDREIDEKGVR